MVDLAENVNLRVHVTRDDIQRGVPMDACRCPVALAVNRAVDILGFEAAVSAYLMTLSVDGEQRFYFCTTPDIASSFLIEFDQGKASGEPFEFDLSFRLSNHPPLDD